MNVEEIRQSYRELRETLSGLGVTWVLHQVDETIRTGNRVEKETHIFKEKGRLEQAGSVGDCDVSERT
jgi:hypothetical protein